MAKAKKFPFPTAVLGPPPDRWCSLCEQVKPAKDFAVKNSNGHLSSRCKVCEASLSRDRKKIKDAQLLAGKLRSQKQKLHHVSELCAEMVSRFGTIEDFTVYWKKCIDKAYEINPGGKVVLEHMKSVAQLIILTNQITGGPQKTEDISDEDLEREFEELGMRVLTAQFEDMATPQAPALPEMVHE